MGARKVESGRRLVAQRLVLRQGASKRGVTEVAARHGPVQATILPCMEPGPEWMVERRLACVFVNHQRDRREATVFVKRL